MKKKSKRNHRTSQNKSIINVFLKSLLSVFFLTLEITVYLACLGCPPTLRWYLDLLWEQLRL